MKLINRFVSLICMAVGVGYWVWMAGEMVAIF
jgi:hypothetical protein